MFPSFHVFSAFCCSLPSKSNVIGKEVQQREMLTSFHRTLDDAWWLRAKSTVEKYVVVQVMELHDESEEESREPRPGVQRCENNGKLRGAHPRRGNEDCPERFRSALHWGETWCACRPYVSGTHALSTRPRLAGSSSPAILRLEAVVSIKHTCSGSTEACFYKTAQFEPKTRTSVRMGA